MASGVPTPRRKALWSDQKSFLAVFWRIFDRVVGGEIKKNLNTLFQKNLNLKEEKLSIPKKKKSGFKTIFNQIKILLRGESWPCSWFGSWTWIWSFFAVTMCRANPLNQCLSLSPSAFLNGDSALSPVLLCFVWPFKYIPVKWVALL